MTLGILSNGVYRRVLSVIMGLWLFAAIGDYFSGKERDKMKLSILLKVILVVAAVLGLGVWLSGWPGAVESQEPPGEGLNAQAVVVNTVFTYQGFLKNGSNPANGPF